MSMIENAAIHDEVRNHFYKADHAIFGPLACPTYSAATEGKDNRKTKRGSGGGTANFMHGEVLSSQDLLGDKQIDLGSRRNLPGYILRYIQKGKKPTLYTRYPKNRQTYHLQSTCAVRGSAPLAARMLMTPPATELRACA